MTVAAAVVVAYVATWVGVYLLVHHTGDGTDAQNSTTAPSIVLAVEAVKLVFSSLLFCKTKGSVTDL